MLKVKHIENLIETSKESMISILDKVQQLRLEDLMSCEAFWMGNDPIKREAVADYQSNEPFLLVGTSMFGSISLACHLADGSDYIPEIIIVDNSSQVTQCWELTKAYFKDNEESNVEKFVAGFISYLNSNNFYRLSMDVDSGNIKEFQDFLINLMSEDFESVKKMVNNAIILKQSWSDISTFEAIREHYKGMNIYAYPSNIIHSIRDVEVQKKVATCVEALKPILSIQTNLFNGEPTTVHLIRNNTADFILRTLGPGPFQEKQQSFFANPLSEKTTTPVSSNGMEFN